MNARKWQRIEQLFNEALERDTAGRATYLAAECGSDVELKEEVEALLDAHEKAEGFLGRPAVEAAAGLAVHDEPTEPQPNPANEDARPKSDGLLGEVLDGKYRITKLLGKGGMGAVFRATHIPLGRDVAVKIMRSVALSDAEALARFKREALAVARLKHPHIVTVHDYEVSDGAGAYLVMELLEGSSLRNELSRRKRLPLGEAVRLLLQVLDAIAAAHREGVIHRDLKPENIFLEDLDGGGTIVKVLDFGIAKVQLLPEMRGEARTTRDGVILGTPSYMAPEQWRGEEADPRSDLYAIGCLFYEMLAARPPVAADRMHVMMFKHLQEEPEPLTSIDPSLPPIVDALIVRALAKDARDRFSSADEFAQALLAVEPSAGGGDPDGETLIMAPAHQTLAQKWRDTGGTRNNLPHQATRFVGRARQVQEVRRALGSTRLLTLTGPGGVGKTRLALEAASQSLDDYPAGVWLVKLASVNDPCRVPSVIAASVDPGDEPGGDPLAALSRRIGARRMLVVLDNCEHMVATCARAADELVRSCSNLRVLATSREPLVIAGETVWVVPPLGVPEPEAPVTEETIAETEAAQLFLDRAVAARPGFAPDERTAPLVAQLVRRLDGIPLAIELAAARMRAMTLDQMVAKLDDVFKLLTGGSRAALPRQQTLKATIDWSYDVLEPDERRLFRRLSVFSGGWTLEGAEAMGILDAEDERSDEPMVDVLSHLIDRSLVVMSELPEGPRYRMLEVIRQYAEERLDESGERDRARVRQREFMLEFAESHYDDLVGKRQVESLALYEAEHSNFRLALDYVAPGEDGVTALRLSIALGRFFAFRGHWREGLEYVEKLLLAAVGPSDRLRARSLYWIAIFKQFRGDIGGALVAAESALRVRSGLTDASELSKSLHQMADILHRVGRVEEAMPFAEQCLAIARQMASPVDIGAATNLLGLICVHLGDLDSAARWYEESLDVHLEMGRTEALAGLMHNLGTIERDRGNFEAAKQRYEQSAEIQGGLGGTQLRQLNHEAFAALARVSGRFDDAERLYREALSEARHLGDSWHMTNCLVGLASIANDRGDRAEALALVREALEVDPEQANKEALSDYLFSSAKAAIAAGEPERALELTGAAEKVRELVGMRLAPFRRQMVDEIVAAARERLSLEEAEKVFIQGRNLDLAGAIRLALESTD